MRNSYLLIFLLAGCLAMAQNDTIQVSTSTAVVIFPTDISDRILGDDITFFMSEQNDGGSAFSRRILKLYYNESPNAKNRYTNLTVITTNGNSYEFTLEYQKNPSQKTWYIKPEQAVTNILGTPVNSNYQKETATTASDMPTGSGTNGTTTDEIIPEVEAGTEETISEATKPTKELYETDKEEYYRLRSYYMQFDKAKLPRFFARSGDVFLWLKGVYFSEDEIYLQFRLENQESIDFDLNFLKFSIATSYKKSSSNQKTEILPAFRYKVPKEVKGNTENHFVVVFKKFSLDRNKVLVVDLAEENGNRNLSLEIDHNLINNPFKI